MGIGGIGIWQLLIILVIVLLLFGTKKLKNLGGDLGGAIKGFKKAMNDDKSGGKDGDDAKTAEIAAAADATAAASNADQAAGAAGATAATDKAGATTETGDGKRA